MLFFFDPLGGIPLEFPQKNTKKSFKNHAPAYFDAIYLRTTVTRKKRDKGNAREIEDIIREKSDELNVLELACIGWLTFFRDIPSLQKEKVQKREVCCFLESLPQILVELKQLEMY